MRNLDHGSVGVAGSATSLMASSICQIASAASRSVKWPARGAGAVGPMRGLRQREGER